MRFESVIIASYVRSGSTLLQGILNTIPGVLVRGENNDFARNIFHSYRALEQAKAYSFNQRPSNATHPWYGIEAVDLTEYLRTCGELVRNVVVPDGLRGGVRCFGFKEVRYMRAIEELDAYLDFLQRIMPSLAVVFNFRNHDAVIGSGISCGWWRKEEKQTVRASLQSFEAKALTYQQDHPDHAFAVRYEDVVAQSQNLLGLFRFLGADYPAPAIADVLLTSHSTRTQQDMRVLEVGSCTPGPDAVVHSSSNPHQYTRLLEDGTAEKLRFVRPKDLAHVYCVVKGRRRHVPYSGWWTDEGWRAPPRIEMMDRLDLFRIPLGPPCPTAAWVRGKSVDQMVHDPHIMRAYLGLLVNGTGIEFGAGRRPLPISLGAEITYVDAFMYGSGESRSYPGVTDFSEFIHVDLVDRIELMQAFQDESLDFVLASHVIEHSPNPIAAMVSAHRLLRHGGKFILIVPNKDRTFDKPRETTSVPHMVLDYEDYRRERDLLHYEEWQTRVVAGSKEAAGADWRAGTDLHYHCFTPASFTELVSAASKYAEWSKTDVFSPGPDTAKGSGEFYVVMQK